MTVERPVSSQDVRPLDDLDRSLLAHLSADGRMTNSALAEAVGVAPSTCLARVRALVDRGVIRGFHAEVDPAALGLELRAVIAVRLRPDARAAIGTFARRLAALPGVQHLYFLAGADDFLLDVVAEDTAALRQFVVRHLSEDPGVATTETNLVFEFVRGGRTAGR